MNCSSIIPTEEAVGDRQSGVGAGEYYTAVRFRGVAAEDATGDSCVAVGGEVHGSSVLLRGVIREHTQSDDGIGQDV